MIKRTVYIGNPSYIYIKDRQLIVERKSEVEEKESNQLAVEDIGVFILDNQQISITQRTLQMLLDNNTIILVCGQNHMPQGMLFPVEGNTTQTERYRDQIESSIPLKKQLWQQTVAAKIRNQANLLTLFEIKTDNMLRWASEVRSGDSLNHEARAAAYYWSNLFHECFKRERLGEPPNNFLNYGYAVLRAVIARSLVGSGLLLSLGLHHRNKYNAFCLADDVMEPYRPFVDKLVISIMSDAAEGSEELTTEIKKKLLMIPAMDVIINGMRSPLMVAAQRTSASLAKCFAGESRKILFPELK